jgi:hypothetical protein
MPEFKRQNERLIAVLVIGFILLNYPLLSLFSKGKLFFGVPVLYLYLFLVWVCFIGCVAIILEKTKSPSIIANLPKTKKTE